MTISYTATYSPEDNKLRLYASQRLDADTYQRVKDAGFRWAPKQELFVAPKWTPQREDLLTELAGEIEPEQMTLADRAEIKAARLEGYAANRERDANAFARRADEIARRFEFGQPILIGHHSERSARRDQARLDSATRASIKASKTANYWQYRAEGVERHVNRKNNYRTRANRIKTLLAELRDLQRAINAAHRAIELWQKIDTTEKLFHVMRFGDPRALFIPFNKSSSDIEGNDEAAEVLRASCIKAAERTAYGPTRQRWIAHTLHRLAYERALLGTVARFEGDLTPAILQTFARTHGAEKPTATKTGAGQWRISCPVPLPAHIADASEHEASADEWRDLMQSVGYEVPAPIPAKAPVLNIDTDSHTTFNGRFYAHEYSTYEVVKITRAEYSKIPTDYRRVKLSACGQYRFKIALGRFIARAHGGEHGHNYVAVFLTDSKAHPAPQAQGELLEAAE